MDTSEPSTNGISSSNLYRLSSLLADDSYAQKAKETASSFESEMLQYPWLFASFMPSIVAGKLGIRGVVVSEGKGKEVEGVEARDVKKIKEFEKAPRGGLGTFIKIDARNTWLRERNELLTRFGLDGKGRVLVCEGGVCTEEGLEEREETKTKVDEETILAVSADEGTESSTPKPVVEEARSSPHAPVPTSEEVVTKPEDPTPEPRKIVENAPSTPNVEAHIEETVEQEKEEIKGELISASILKDVVKALPVVGETPLTEQNTPTTSVEESITLAVSAPSEPVIDPALKRELLSEQGKEGESIASTSSTTAVDGGKKE